MKTMLPEPWWKLFVTLYNPEFYRPLDHLLIRANLVLFGGEPILYRWFSIAGHLLTILFVYSFARRWQFTRPVALFAAAYFGLSHANAMAVLSNDAASQIFSTFFGSLTLLCLMRKEPETPVHPAWYFIGALALAGSLLWKDAGVSYLLPTALLIWREWRSTAPERRRRMIVSAAVPFAVILSLYFAFRVHAGAVSPKFCGPGRYDLCPGLNAPMNLFFFLLGLLTPVGSSIVVLRLQQWWFLALWIAFCLGVLGTMIGGLYLRSRSHPEDRRRFRWLYALLFLLMLPDIFIRQVSELYIYRPNTLFAILAGAGFAALLQFFYRRQNYIRWFLLVLFYGVMIWSQVESVHHKTLRLRTNGILAHQLMIEIMSQYPKLESRTILTSNRVPGPAPLYSIYYMEGIYVLGGGKIFEYYYGVKPDKYGYYPFAELTKAIANVPGKKLILLFRRNHVLAAVSDGPENPFRNTPP